MYILVEVQIWQKCCIWTFMLFIIKQHLRLTGKYRHAYTKNDKNEKEKRNNR